MGMGVSSGYSGMEGKPNTQSKIEAKYPALLFKQHLTACVEKIYGMIRDSLKKEIGPFLNLCIQVKTYDIIKNSTGHDLQKKLLSITIKYNLLGTKICKV